MSSIRTERVNADVKRVLTGLLPKLKDPRIHGLVTITKVEVAGDLQNAKVYVSMLCDDAEKKEILAGLRSAAGWLRRELGGALDTRNTPALTFINDNSTERGARILELINQTKEDGK